MTDIFDLLEQFAEEETKIQNTTFLAPYTKGGQVWTKVNGIIYKFKTIDLNFEGWGIFQSVDAHTAKLLEPASFVQVENYLQLLPYFRLHLIHPVKKQTWLAYPVNEIDAKTRLGVYQPFLIHLVKDGQAFEQVTAVWNGSSFWYKDIDRKANIFLAEDTRQALQAWKPIEELAIKGLTPEMKISYELALNHKIITYKHPEIQSGEKRLRKALKVGGGKLHKFRDKGDYWIVEWYDGQQNLQHSSIAKNDLTVISSGICLSGEDSNFDLQSLVGVIEQDS